MAREERATGRETAGRKGRIGLGGMRTRLTAPTRAGYVRRWVNDMEGRLEVAEQEDYQFVVGDSVKQIGSSQDIDNINRDMGSRVSRVVDKSTGMKAYLMEIKEEYYAEDQAKKAAAVAAIDRQIKDGKIEDDPSRYIPDKGRGIAIETR